MRAWTRRAAALAILAAASPATAAGQDVDAKAVYDRWCAGCHGEDGRGAGPGAATMLPRPRDFTDALYQVRTTASGELPTDADILRVIDDGMPGTAMPGWEDVLARDEREALVAYLKSFSDFFEDEAPEALDFGQAPGASDERLADGEQVYTDLECWRCHGRAGRGDGASAPTLEDDYGFPIAAADLTENWRFNGGGTVEEIFRRFMTGMDGTPMPTQSDVLDANIVTEDQLWSLAHYVRSMAPPAEPEIRELIEVEQVTEGVAPTALDDPRWEEAERFYVPLVGQIVIGPRWFNPRVDGIWVQGLHDGQELALRISWSDPSASPDPDWQEYAERVMEVMEPRDPGSATAWGAPDRLVVQFPQTQPTGLARPYFLQGDARRPTYLWSWTSGAEGGVEAVARGMGTAAPQPAESQTLVTESRHAEGEWQVLFRRSLATADGEGDLQLPVGEAVPVAFQAWDGDNGERGNQGSVSTWIFLALQEATPLTVFVAPGLAMLLTLGLGIVLVGRAQRRVREA